MAPVLTCLLPFFATERSRVLEKKVNETQVSKTVFSHLKGRFQTRSAICQFSEVRESSTAKQKDRFAFFSYVECYRSKDLSLCIYGRT